MAQSYGPDQAGVGSETFLVVERDACRWRAAFGRIGNSFRILGLLASLVLALALPTNAKAQATVNWSPSPGTLGWCTGVGGGAVSCYSSPGAACRAQYQAFVASFGAVYQGYANDSHWYIKNCRWFYPTGFGPFPSSVDWECDFGYVRQAPGRCVSATLDIDFLARALGGGPGICLPCTPRPIDIVSGTKVFRARDFDDGRLPISRTFSSAPLGGIGVAVGAPTAGLANWALDFAYELQISTSWAQEQVVGVLVPTGGAYRFDRNSTTGFMEPQITSTQPMPQSDYALTYDGTWPTNLNTLTAAKTRWTLTGSDDRIWRLETFADPDSGQFVVARPVKMVEPGGRELAFAYGPSYELTSITDSTGGRVTFDWIWTNVPAAIGAAHLPDGGTLQYLYEPLESGGTTPDRLIRVEHRDPGGVLLDQTSYGYDDARFPLLVTSVKDRDGVVRWTVTYDANGRALTSSGPSNAENYSVAYGDGGFTFSRTVTNPLGKVSVYNFARTWPNAYDVRLTSVVEQASANSPAATSSLAFGTDHFISSETDAEGRVTGYVRDAKGRAIQVVQAQGTALARTKTITWHASINAPTQIVSPGLTTAYVYAAGASALAPGTSGPTTTVQRLASMTQTDTTTITSPYPTNGRTRTWAYTWSDTGKLLTVDGPRAGSADTTTYAYNANDFLASVTDAAGHVTTITAWNGRGEPLTVVEFNGVTTALTYDMEGRLLTATVNPGPRQSQHTLQYNAVGDVTQITLPEGGVLQYAYDTARRLTQITNSRGETQTFTPNAMGKPTAVTIRTSGAAIAAQQTAAYDELGRVIRSVGAGSQTTGFSYDKVDNLTAVTDARGKAFHTGFDALDRAITQTNPESQTVQLAYSPSDVVTNHKDGRNLETTRVVDGFGKVIQETSPDRGTRIYSYDEAGNLTRLVDGDGQQTDYAYDAANRVQSATFAGAAAETITYAYDDTTAGNKGVGRLTGVTEQSGSSAFTYDVEGRLTRDVKTIQGRAYAVQYAYDRNGKVTSLTLPSGRIVTITRTTDGLITDVATQATPTASTTAIVSDASYAPFGPLQSLTYGNGLALTRTFDANYWLTQTQVNALGVTRLDLSFGRNANGQLTSVTDNAASGRGGTFGYNDSGRLNAATGPWGSDAYTYDAAGTRLDKARTIAGVTAHDTAVAAGNSNRIVQVLDGAGAVKRTLTYRAGGDLIQDALTGASTYVYGYDARKRLVSAGAATADQGSYGYDYQGHRVWRTVVTSAATVQTHYIFDRQGHLIAEHDGATGAVEREYVWLGDMPVAMIDSTSGTSQTYFIHTGQIEEPLVMTDASKTKVWDAYVEPFGAAQVFGAPSAGLDLRLPGQFTEAETGGLHQNWNRDYDTSLGRYIEADPLGLGAGQNVYGYADGDPLNKVDPSGRFFNLAVGALVGGGVDLGIQLAANHGRLSCVNWWEVGGYALLGAITQGGSALEEGAALGEFGILEELIAAEKAAVGTAATDGAAVTESVGAAESHSIQANKVSGDAIRDEIAAREMPALTEQTFNTIGGTRRVDVLKLGDETLAIESKVGRTALDSRVRQELARDWWLKRQGQVDDVRWEFTPSKVTGNGGPTPSLLQKLEKLGFDVRINP